jgi:hypothetical protein
MESSIQTIISLITNRPLNTQAIIGLSTLTKIQVHQFSSTQPIQP